MKKIETIVRGEVAKQVIDAINKIPGIGGVTLVQALGKGAGDRPWIGDHQIEFNAVDMIVTVVEESNMNSVITAIIDIAHTGEKGDGKIFISDIAETVDISTKEKMRER